MILTSQDHKILSAILENGNDITVYKISKITRISIPQVQYRLDKMQQVSIIFKQNNSYYPHPALVNKNIIKLIANNLSEIIKQIDLLQPTSAEGLKTLIDYIVYKTDIKEDTNNSS